MLRTILAGGVTGSAAFRLGRSLSLSLSLSAARLLSCVAVWLHGRLPEGRGGTKQSHYQAKAEQRTARGRERSHGIAQKATAVRIKTASSTRSPSRVITHDTTQTDMTCKSVGSQTTGSISNPTTGELRPNCPPKRRLNFETQTEGPIVCVSLLGMADTYPSLSISLAG